MLFPNMWKQCIVISIAVVTLVEPSETERKINYLGVVSKNSDLSQDVQNSFNLNQECHCINYNCGCCEHLEVEKIHLNSTVCVNLTYLPEDIGFSFTVSIGNRTVFNETISARSPPPVCFGVPYLKEYAAICIKFYDLDVTLHKVHGCVKLEARLSHVEVGDYELGCFDISRANDWLYLLSKQIKKAETGKFLTKEEKRLTEEWSSLVKSNDIPQVLVV